MKEIIVAGGCFWGVCEYFNRIKGISTSRAVYAQGKKRNPSYEEVCTGTTGFTEGAYLVYDQSIITLEQIIEHLFRIIDPTSLNKQGNDIGTQYRTGIYYFENEQNKIMDEIIKLQKNYDKKILVEVEEVINYFDAEEYHQDYLVKNPTGYCHVDFTKIKNEEKK